MPFGVRQADPSEIRQFAGRSTEVVGIADERNGVDVAEKETRIEAS